MVQGRNKKPGFFFSLLYEFLHVYIMVWAAVAIVLTSSPEKKGDAYVE